MNIKQLRTTFTIVCFTQFAKILNSKIHLTLGPHTFLHRITTSGVKIRFCLLKWWGQRGGGGGVLLNRQNLLSLMKVIC